MPKEDKVLANYRKQLQLAQEALGGYEQGNTSPADIAKTKQNIARLKMTIQGYERRTKHG